MMKVKYGLSVAEELEKHRGCLLRTDRIYNNDTPALGVLCRRHHDEVVLEFELPVRRKTITVEVDVMAWWPEELPDPIDLARGVWEALPAEWTDPNVGDEFWIADINPASG